MLALGAFEILPRLFGDDDELVIAIVTRKQELMWHLCPVGGEWGGTCFPKSDLSESNNLREPDRIEAVVVA